MAEDDGGWSGLVVMHYNGGCSAEFMIRIKISAKANIAFRDATLPLFKGIPIFSTPA